MTDAKPSKSAQKREQLALKKLGQELIGLKDTELEKLPLDAELRAAVRAARSMRAHGALRRQRLLIAKLMRGADTDAIQASLSSLRASEQRSKRRFAAAEHWRDRLVNGDAATLDAFAKATGRPIGELRDLVNAAQNTVDERRQKTLQREIFRHVHGMLSSDG